MCLNDMSVRGAEGCECIATDREIVLQRHAGCAIFLGCDEVLTGMCMKGRGCLKKRTNLTCSHAHTCTHSITRASALILWGLLIDNKRIEVAGVIQMCVTHRTDRHSPAVLHLKRWRLFLRRAAGYISKRPLTSRRNNLNIKIYHLDLWAETAEMMSHSDIGC